MEYRYLGNSGLKVSEITYGNWLTHASQVENDAAIAADRASATWACVIGSKKVVPFADSVVAASPTQAPA